MNYERVGEISPQSFEIVLTNLHKKANLKLTLDQFKTVIMGNLIEMLNFALSFMNQLGLGEELTEAYIKSAVFGEEKILLFNQLVKLIEMKIGEKSEK